MPTFHYIARAANGETNTGSLEAHAAIDAMNQLRRRGLRVERLQNDADAPAQTEPNPESVTHPGDGVSDAAAETADPANVAWESRNSPKSPDGSRASQSPSCPYCLGFAHLTEGLPSRSLRRGLQRSVCGWKGGNRSKRHCKGAMSRFRTISAG